MLEAVRKCPNENQAEEQICSNYYTPIIVGDRVMDYKNSKNESIVGALIRKHYAKSMPDVIASHMGNPRYIKFDRNGNMFYSIPHEDREACKKEIQKDTDWQAHKSTEGTPITGLDDEIPMNYEDWGLPTLLYYYVSKYRVDNPAGTADECISNVKFSGDGVKYISHTQRLCNFNSRIRSRLAYNIFLDKGFCNPQTGYLVY